MRQLQRESEEPVRSETAPADVCQEVSDAIYLLSKKRTRFTFSDVLNSLDAREQISAQADRPLIRQLNRSSLFRSTGIKACSPHLCICWMNSACSIWPAGCGMRLWSGKAGGMCLPEHCRKYWLKTDPLWPLSASVAWRLPYLEGIILAAELVVAQGCDVRVLATDSRSALFLREQCCAVLAGYHP